MVEMLGVLAIIGVLSVGGIVGYRLAMTKWQANETLSELNLRAHTYLEVLARTGSVGEDSFGETTRQGYSVELGWDGTATPKELEIMLSGVEPSVCRELVNSGWPLPNEILVGEKTATAGNCELAEADGLTFVFDTDVYETGAADAGDNTGNPDYAGEDAGFCENGNPYLSYKDNPCEEIEMNNTTCTGNWDCGCGAACCIDGQCVSGETDLSTWETVCEPSDSCVKNSDCQNGEYCNLTGSDCEKPSTGMCATVSGKTDITVNGKTFRVSQKGMQWWAAENWCKAQGIRLASLEDLGCEARYGYCTSETLAALRAGGVSEWLWTSSAFSSCSAWYVSGDGYVSSASRSGNSAAVCVGG